MHVCQGLPWLDDDLAINSSVPLCRYRVGHAKRSQYPDSIDIYFTLYITCRIFESYCFLPEVQIALTNQRSCRDGSKHVREMPMCWRRPLNVVQWTESTPRPLHNRKPQLNLG